MSGSSQQAQGRVLAGDAPSARQSFFKKRLPLLLGAATGILLCVIGLFVVLALGSKTSASLPAPDATANAICQDLRGANYAALYGLLAPSLQQQGANAQTEFITSQRQLDILSGKVVSCSYQTQPGAGTQLTVNFSVMRGTQAVQSGQVVLLYANGSWRISSYDTSII